MKTKSDFRHIKYNVISTRIRLRRKRKSVNLCLCLWNSLVTGKPTRSFRVSERITACNIELLRVSCRLFRRFLFLFSVVWSTPVLRRRHRRVLDRANKTCFFFFFFFSAELFRLRLRSSP